MPLFDIALVLVLLTVVVVRKTGWTSITIAISGLVATTVLGLSHTEQMIAIGIWGVEYFVEYDRRIRLGWMLATIVVAVLSLVIGLYEIAGDPAIALNKEHWLAMMGLPGAPFGIFLLPMVVSGRKRFLLMVLMFVAALLTDGSYLSDVGRSDLLMQSFGRTLLISLGFVVAMVYLWCRAVRFRGLVLLASFNIFLVIIVPRFLGSYIADATVRSFPLVSLAMCLILASSMYNQNKSTAIYALLNGTMVALFIVPIFLKSSSLLDTLAGTKRVRDQVTQVYQSNLLCEVSANYPATPWFFPNSAISECSRYHFLYRSIPQNVQSFWLRASVGVSPYDKLVESRFPKDVQTIAQIAVWYPPIEVPDFITWREFFEICYIKEIQEVSENIFYFIRSKTEIHGHARG